MEEILLDPYSSGTQDGLCCSLVVPCPKERPIVQFRDLEVPRESVVISKELGHGFFGEVYQGILYHVAIDTLAMFDLINLLLKERPRRVSS